MVKRLTDAIIEAIGEKQFHIDLAETTARCRQFLERGIYTVYKAVHSETDRPIGFIALCESHALYAEGTFGIIQELFVEPAHRSRGIGRRLVEAAIDHGKKRDGSGSKSAPRRSLHSVEPFGFMSVSPST